MIMTLITKMKNDVE